MAAAPARGDSASKPNLARVLPMRDSKSARAANGSSIASAPEGSGSLP
jgi:hypothetical protein